MGMCCPGQWTLILLLSVLPVLLPAGCTWHLGHTLGPAEQNIYIKTGLFGFFYAGDWPQEAQNIAASLAPETTYPAVPITNPHDGSVFPADMAAPTFSWQDTKAKKWLLVFSSRQNTGRIFILTHRPVWTPGKETWETMKSRWLEEKTQAVVLGINRTGDILTQGQVCFRVSKDPVGAPVVYQEIPLPFSAALKHTNRFQWRIGDISAYEKPKTILKNPPSCMFCHAFSGDGKTFGIDVDHKGDKGGYILAEVGKHVKILPENVISWNDLKIDKTLPNMGLFSKISPDGKYVVSTVNEQPFMITMDHTDFSQLFFPLTGRLAVYAKENGRFFPLTGADNPDFVQTSPAWSPDGRHVIFARAGVDERLKAIMGKKRLLFRNSKLSIAELNKRYRIRFNLYSVPFNNGRGGDPVPIEGASFNDSSNYFPRVSPDGKWIVFNRSDTGIVAQPTSTLYIIPFQGGRARKMNCNTAHYNSWHTWSPNGRWLGFTPKVNPP